MIIGPTSPLGGSSPVEPSEMIRSVPSKDPLPPIQDELAISEAAGLAAETMAVDAVRLDRVGELRMLIEAGSFETAERLEAAVGRLLAELI